MLGTGSQCRERRGAHRLRRLTVSANEISLIDRKCSDIPLSGEDIQNVDALSGDRFQVRRVGPPRAVLIVELCVLGHPTEGSKRRLVHPETLALLFESLRKNGQLTTIYFYMWSNDHFSAVAQG